MSGTNYEITCPNCQQDCSASEDHKPFPCVSVECYECGFVVFTSDKYLNLKELNEKREEIDLNPLTKLPNQTWAY